MLVRLVVFGWPFSHRPHIFRYFSLFFVSLVFRSHIYFGSESEINCVEQRLKCEFMRLPNKHYGPWSLVWRHLHWMAFNRNFPFSSIIFFSSFSFQVVWINWMETQAHKMVAIAKSYCNLKLNCLFLCVCAVCSRINWFSTPDISNFKWNENEIDLIFNPSLFRCFCCLGYLKCSVVQSIFKRFQISHTQNNAYTNHDNKRQNHTSLSLTLALSLFTIHPKTMTFFDKKKFQFSIRKITFSLEIFSEHFSWFCSRFLCQIKYEPTTAYDIPPSPMSNCLQLFSSIFKLKYDFIAERRWWLMVSISDCLTGTISILGSWLILDFDIISSLQWTLYVYSILGIVFLVRRACIAWINSSFSHPKKKTNQNAIVNYMKHGAQYSAECTCVRLLIHFHATSLMHTEKGKTGGQGNTHCI